MWPPEALDFLREPKDNNDRDWFKANRARYDEYLVVPGRALAETLGHLGEARFFRPYNDARFHARPPIKEQLGIVIGDGYYVELSLDGLLVGAGLHHPLVRPAAALPRGDRRRPPRRGLRARARHRHRHRPGSDRTGAQARAARLSPGSSAHRPAGPEVPHRL